MTSFAFPVLIPDWPLPRGVRSVITMRPANRFKDGSDHEHLLALPPSVQNSSDPYSCLYNKVQTARKLLARQLDLKLAPQWLQQEHGVTVVEASENGVIQVADASFSRRRGLACAVLTADCLPLLVSAKDGSLVAAIHAGWRGLASGIIANTLNALSVDPGELIVYLGPGISQQHFEVGPEVRQAFLGAVEEASLNKGLVGSNSTSVAECFRPSELSEGHYFADLYQLARIQLQGLGVTDIYGGEYCTFAQAALFYSHRRDRDEGRMASLIWMP